MMRSRCQLGFREGLYKLRKGAWHFVGLDQNSMGKADGKTAKSVRIVQSAWMPCDQSQHSLSSSRI